MSESLRNARYHDLRARAHGLADRFRALLDDEWSDPRADQLHEELDALVIESDIDGDGALSEAALELSTYLCSFVGGQVEPPNQIQCQRMRQFVAGLATSTPRPSPAQSGGAQILPLALAASRRTDADPCAGREVWAVLEPSPVAAGLAAELVARGVPFQRAAGADALASIPQRRVQCVLVDPASLALLPELQHRALEAGVARPTFVALLGDGGTRERLRALRAGADHVLVAGAGPAALAGRLERILAARSEEPLRVLVVDDDASQTRMCAGVLARVGIDPVCCNSGEAALAELRNGLPDILLVDLHMPGIDGLGLVELLNDQPGAEQVAVLFLSGDEEPDTRYDALAAGGDDFLAKPVQPRQLIRAVTAHGRRAQLRRRAQAV
jgi:DNA-binding response OmpR family regulator